MLKTIGVEVLRLFAWYLVALFCCDLAITLVYFQLDQSETFIETYFQILPKISIYAMGPALTSYIILKYRKEVLMLKKKLSANKGVEEAVNK